MSEQTAQLLVLGAGLEPDGSGSPQTIERAMVTAEHYDLHGASLIVFSGGYPSLAPENAKESSEARIMGDIAVANGVPERLVRLEEHSTTQLSNVINSAPILGPEDVILIVHRIQSIRGLYTGQRLLSSAVGAAEIAEPDDMQRPKQEQRLLLLTKLILAGVSQGDIRKAARRNLKVERTASRVAPILHRTVLRNHTSLGSGSLWLCLILPFVPPCVCTVEIQCRPL